MTDTTAIVQRPEEWHEARRSGLGGSDAATALGMNPWKSPYALFLEKRGEAPAEDLSGVERVRMGSRMEAAIAEEYTERTGRKVARVNGLLRHREHPWMIGNIDRRVVGERRGVEIKNVDKDSARFGDWGDAGTDEVPPVYMLQVQHYLAVTGWPVFDLAALIGGNELRVYPIARDEELIAGLIEGEGRFWRDHVLAGVPPTPKTADEARERFPVSSARPIGATEEILHMVRDLVVVKADLKRAEALVEQAQAEVMAFMGDADTLTHGASTLVTWKSAKPSMKLDVAALAAAHPDIVAAFTREAPGGRRFLVK